MFSFYWATTLTRIALVFATELAPPPMTDQKEWANSSSSTSTKIHKYKNKSNAAYSKIRQEISNKYTISHVKLRLVSVDDGSASLSVCVRFDFVSHGSFIIFAVRIYTNTLLNAIIANNVCTLNHYFVIPFFHSEAFFSPSVFISVLPLSERFRMYLREKRGKSAEEAKATQYFNCSRNDYNQEKIVQ